MKIKKGVIAAAGWSTRFLPVAKAYAKHLVPVLDKPAIQYLVEMLLAAGIEEIAIVHRHGEKTIRDHFKRNPELDKYLKNTGKEQVLQSLRDIWKKAKVIKFYPQGRSLPYGNATPLLVIKKFLANEPFVYLFGDDFIIEKRPGHHLKQLINLYQKHQPAAVVSGWRVAKKEICRYGCISYKKKGKVTNQMESVVEKPPVEEAPSDVAQVSPFVVSPKIFSVLETLKLGKGGELWFADAINALAKEDVVIAQPIKNGIWETTGDPLRWLKVNLMMGLKNKETKEGLGQFFKQHLSGKI